MSLGGLKGRPGAFWGVAFSSSFHILIVLSASQVIRRLPLCLRDKGQQQGQDKGQSGRPRQCVAPGQKGTALPTSPHLDLDRLVCLASDQAASTLLLANVQLYTPRLSLHLNLPPALPSPAFSPLPSPSPPPSPQLPHLVKGAGVDATLTLQ